MKSYPHISQLIEAFIDAAIKHQTFSVSDWKKANKEAKKIQKAFLEISALGQPGREALLDLVNSEEHSVSLMAAVYSLKYNIEKSMKALRNLTNEPGLIGFQAEQAIKRWEEGTWDIE